MHSALLAYWPVGAMLAAWFAIGLIAVLRGEFSSPPTQTDEEAEALWWQANQL